MISQKRRFALGLAVFTMLASTTLAGCSSSGTKSADSASPSPAGSTTVSPAAKSSDPVKLEVIENAAAMPAPDADFIKQALDKALGLNLMVTSYAAVADYQNNLNVRVASANYPDLFQIVDRQALAQLSQSDVLLDLTPYLDKLGSVKKFLGEDNLKKGYYNGKLYAINKAPQIDYWTYWVRKDWLDKLNLKVPTTLDELYAVAKAFTENDPDGNGKKDTVGITGGSGGGFHTFNFNGGVGAAISPILGGHGVGIPGSVYIKDGKAVDAYHDPAMIEALTDAKKYFDAKVIDSEVAANTGLQHQQKAIQGQAGIVYIDWANIKKDQFVEQTKAVNPKAEWIQIAAPKGPAGQFDGTWDSGKSPMMLGIPKKLEKDPVKLQKVFDLLNYVSEGKGAELVQYGIEGKHYTLENGKPKPTDLLGKEGGYIWSYQFTGRPELEYLSARFVNQASYIDFTSKQPRIQAVNGYLDIPSGYNPAEADRYGTEEIIKFLYGKRPLSEYDQFLKTLDTQFNYKAFQESAQKQLKSLGMTK
ncbi:extracellular solute-binding protein [Paenibacillus ferrarius]|uniref:extracellular solute-binding protein n=1 Tax=Paenibacillus ferrarius TaxID=1469647 RepID=UPI001ABF8F88|nr:extracellular solute-binding protein [Paenibacillus ferrarius]